MNKEKESNGVGPENVNLFDPESGPKEQPVHTYQSPQSVPEKIIFCIDELLMTKKFRSFDFAFSFCQTIRQYIDIKAKIATKTPEFFIVMLSNPHTLYPLPDGDSVVDVCENIKRNATGINGAVHNLELLFTGLAETLSLPDPNLYRSAPPYVISIILFFGRTEVPFIHNANSYYFLLDNPFFTLNIIHVPTRETEPVKVNKISRALRCIVNSERGYFSEILSGPIDLYKKVFILLGHPLLRVRQDIRISP